MSENKEEIVFSKGGGRDLVLSLFRPDADMQMETAVLMLHGGGWRMGHRAMMDLFGPELARHGFTAIAPEYRLLGESPWPAQLEDVKAAIRWTRANAASLSIRSEKVAVMGFSAGAHLALMAGGTPGMPEFSGNGGNDGVSDGVAAVVAFFPPTGFTTGDPAPGVSEASVLLGDAATEADALQASPTSHVSACYPPAFFLHGTDDTVVPCMTSLAMFQMLNDVKVPAELHLYPGHTHEFVRLPSMMAPVMAEVALFLQRMVVDPLKYVKENRRLNMFAQKDE